MPNAGERRGTNRHALVTGGLGFIGSHLVDRLLGAGESVTVLDNLATGRLQNLAHQDGNPDLRIKILNVDQAPDLADHFQSVDTVYHLAALADIVPSIENPAAYHRANVNGTVAVMEAARVSGVQKLVYAASSSCYGLPDVYPTPETAAIRPQYPYALTKHIGEQIAIHWGAVYGIDVTSLRLFNVFGPRHRTTGAYGAVLGVFLAQKLAGRPLTIVGDGTQTRDFTYVTDIVRAFEIAANGDCRGEVFNVGSGGTYSVNQLADLIGGDRTFIPRRPGEPDQTFADIAKIKKQLGWAPKVSFEEGVRLVLDHIDDWRDAPVWTPETISAATKSWFEKLGRRSPA